jgi:hypothetical protein
MEPAIEERTTADSASQHATATSPWLLPLFVVLAGAMLIAQALAGNTARNGETGARSIYWLSLVVLTSASVAAQVMRGPSRGQRLGLVLTTGLSLYLVKVMSYPNGFTYYDELSHYRTAADILRLDRLFHANPVLAVSPHYPALEVVTAALARLTGLSITSCGLLTVGAARIVLAAALYGVFTEIAESPRVGGLATVLYMANPSFIYFDGDFSYESFALPFAALALLLTIRWMRPENRAPSAGPRMLRYVIPARDRRGEFIGAILALAALTIAHHTTSYLVAVFLALLCVCGLVARRWGGTARIPWQIAVLSVGWAALWLFLVASSTIKYLDDVFGPAVDGVRQVLLFDQPAYTPFSGGTAVAASPLWLKVLAVGSVLLILASLPLALALVRRRRREAALLAVSVVGIAYIPVQALRLTGAGIESANRSFEFVFFGVAVLLALSVVHLVDEVGRPITLSLRGRRLLGRRRLAAYVGVCRLVALAVAAGTVLFVGGVIVIWPSYGLLPGPYIAGADIRSITDQGIAAARWLRREYGPGQRVLTDRSNGQIVAAYADGDPVEGRVGPASVARVFVSSRVDQTDREILRAKQVGFLLIDRRLASAPPARGFYFSSTELNGGVWTHAISLTWLTKFNSTRGFSLVYDNGAIQLYRVLRNGTR